MEIKEAQHDRYVSLAPVGDLDANSSVFLDEKLRSLLEAGQYNIHVNAAEIPYISSAGLGVFISHLDELVLHSGKFVVSNLSDTVADVFKILGLNQLDNLILVPSEREVESHFE